MIQLKPGFIVLEGIDGSGKSTIAKTLQQKIGVESVQTPPPYMSGDLRSHFDNSASLETRFMYYLLGNKCISDYVMEYRKDRLIVSDRYIHSTIAFNKVMGVSLGFDPMLLRLEQPDLSLLFVCSDEEERRSRIAKRGKITKYDSMKDEADFRNRYLAYFRSLEGFIEIDTAGKTEAESLEEVVTVIKEVF